MRRLQLRHNRLRPQLAAQLRRLKASLPSRLAMRAMHVVSQWASADWQEAGRAARPLLGFAAAYLAAWSYLFVAAFLSAKPPPSPLFPPGAVLLAALLLTRPRRWWLYLGVAFVIQVPILASLHVPLRWNLLGFVPDAIEPVIAVSLMRRAISLPPRFASLRDVSLYSACVGVAVMSAATVGAAVNAAAGGEPYGPAWRTWFLSDTLADLVLAPTLVLWMAAGSRGLRAGSRRRYAEAGLLYGGLLVMGLIVFDVRVQRSEPAAVLIYLPVPLLLWAAVRFGPRGIATALSLIAILAIPAVANALGPFASQSTPAASVLDNVFTLQLFMLVIGVPLLFLAALVQEREGAQAALRAEITERTRLEREREAARAEADRQAEQLDRIFEQIADGLIVNDANGRIVRDNRAAQRMLDLEAAPPAYYQLPARERLALFAARDDAGHPLAPEDWPLMRVLRGEVAGAISMDVHEYTLAGREVDITTSAAPLRDAEGRVVGAVSVLHDQTERKRLERERAEQADQLDRIFEGMTDALIVYDAQGQLVRANQAARRLLGLNAAPADYSQLPLRERVALYAVRDEQGRVLAPEETPLLRTLAGETLTGAGAMDGRMRTLDGREVELNVSGAPLRDQEGRVIGAVGILHDQTERKRLEREQEAARARELALREVNERLDTFVSIAAHDLRHPVAVSQMGVELAQLQVLKVAAQVPEAPAKQTQSLIRVEQALATSARNLDRLGRLIRQLLDVPRIREGTLVLSHELVNLADLVRGCVDEQRLLNPSRVLTLTLALPPAPSSTATSDADDGAGDANAGPEGVVVEGDADRLGQVMTNYLINALRYSPEDQPVEVTVRVAAEEAERGTVTEGAARGEVGGGARRVARVEVHDHGPGIPPEEQATIWDRCQGARTASEAGGGLGLGLYIVRTLVERHGGQVGVESTVRQGSTFWFSLPLAPSMATTAAPALEVGGARGSAADGDEGRDDSHGDVAAP